MIDQFATGTHTPPIDATAVLIDLREFTPNLSASSFDGSNRNTFLEFLSEVYALCLDSCVLSMGPSLRTDPPLNVSSTGDGVLAVFFNNHHARSAFLAAMLLHIVVKLRCASYNVRSESLGRPVTSYGIGVESGTVSRLRASFERDGSLPYLETCIGSCINIAARAEALSKSFGFARTIIGPTTNQILCGKLLGQDYEAISRNARDPGLTDAQRSELVATLDSLNRRLCLSFLQYHNLKGIDEPLALFRLSGGVADIGNPRFEKLLELLTESTDHLATVRAFISAHSTLLKRSWAYDFCYDSPAKDLERELNRSGIWKWQLRESHWYGDYLRTFPTEGVRIRIHSFDRGRYSCQIESVERVEADATAIDTRLKALLDAVGARNLRPIEAYD